MGSRRLPEPAAGAEATAQGLVDSFGRVHTSLRISVTDRCNIRCFYCMPADGVRFLPRADILSFEEIERFAAVAAKLGVRQIRLTGGEPLVRSGLPTLVAKLAAIPGIDEVTLTTNGMLLAEQAEALKAAGLRRVNISLDSLSPATFQKISRREGLERVLEGIFAARRAGFERIRLNAVAIAGLTEPEIVPLGQFARQHGFEMRFIEFMPLDSDNAWDSRQVLSGATILRILSEGIAPLAPLPAVDPSQPATDYRFVDGQGTIGLIKPVSEPFCENCNRLRLTAEGKIRNCLFSTAEWDARAILRSGGDEEALAACLRECVAAKRAGHGIDTDSFFRPERAMYQIGG